MRNQLLVILANERSGKIMGERLSIDSSHSIAFGRERSNMRNKDRVNGSPIN